MIVFSLVFTAVVVIACCAVIATTVTKNLEGFAKQVSWLGIFFGLLWLTAAFVGVV